jgi:dienelactone hydrolase
VVFKQKIVQAYIAKPAENLNPKNQAILILTDVFGHELKNAQLIADQFAANGYFVVMPDLLHGDAIPFDRRFSFDIQAWLKGPPGHNPSTIDPVMTSVLKELRTSLGYERVGAVGYCFGVSLV